MQRSAVSKQPYRYDTREWSIEAGWVPYSVAYLAHHSEGKTYLMSTESILEIDFTNKKGYSPDLLDTGKHAKRVKGHPYRKAVEAAVVEAEGLLLLLLFISKRTWLLVAFMKDERHGLSPRRP